MHAIESDSFRTRPRSRARPRESEFYRGRGTRDEYEDDDEVRTLQQRVEVHENDIEFM